MNTKAFNTKISILVVLSAILFSIIGCKKNESATPALQTDSVFDIDGNKYQTVKIGNQWWMTENLKVKHFRNGKSILEIPENSTSLKWDTTVVVAAFCSYPRSSSDTLALGLLYNGYAVADTNNIAPQGWHVATDDDWKEMEKHLGMKYYDAEAIGWRGTDVGNLLKYSSTNPEWMESETPYTVWPNNKSGFSALAGSCRLFNGTWGDPGLRATAFWWTASKNSRKEAWYRYLDYNKAGVFRYYGNISNGYSIRCVKD